MRVGDDSGNRRTFEETDEAKDRREQRWRRWRRGRNLGKEDGHGETANRRENKAVKGMKAGWLIDEQRRKGRSRWNEEPEMCKERVTSRLMEVNMSKTSTPAAVRLQAQTNRRKISPCICHKAASVPRGPLLGEHEPFSKPGSLNTKHTVTSPKTFSG